MKKIVAVLCSLAICFSFAACGKKADDDAANKSGDSKPAKSLAVSAAFVTDANGHEFCLMLENKYEKTVTDFTVAFVSYDANGIATSSEYATTFVSAANILGGESKSIEIYSYDLNGPYVDAMVSEVTFDDGKTAKARGVDSWAEKALKATFPIDEYKSEMAALGENVAESAENKYLNITATFSYDSYLYIVAENISDKTILDFKIGYLCFDANSLPVDGYQTGNVSSANLIAGAKESFSFYETCAYAKAIVTSITFEGGETWENPDALLWSVTQNTFSVDGYKAELEAMKATAAQAETTPYIEIVSTLKFNDNPYSTSDDMDFTLKNTGTLTASKVSLFVLQYDENGYAVTVSPYDTYCKNGRSLGGTANITPGSTESFNSSLFFEGSCSQYKCIVSSVTFEDGTEWNNPYLYEWILVNNKTFA